MLTVEQHEQNITDLSQLLKVEGVDQAKASTLIQAIRDNYSEVSTSISDSVKKITEKDSLNSGLREANMMLLSKLGIQNLDQKPNETKPNETKPNDAMSYEDLAKKLME